jgi:hypothetical protein
MPGRCNITTLGSWKEIFMDSNAQPIFLLDLSCYDF